MKALLRRIKQILRDRRTRRIFTRVISTVAALVVFVTTYALVLPAITLEKTAVCGIEEHQHDDSCYTEELICRIPESEGHHHTDACYSVSSRLTCRLQEHTHSADKGCYDEEGNLICQTPEHTHDDSCCEEVRTLTCGLEESDGHRHGSACYRKVLTCGKEAHIHSAACYEQETSAVAATGTTVESTTNSDSKASDPGADTDSATDTDFYTDTESKTNAPSANNGAASAATGAEAADSSAADPKAGPADTETAAGMTAATDPNANTAAGDTAAAAATTNVLPDELTLENLSDGYVPTLDQIHFDAALTKATGFYYYHPEDGQTTPASSGDITDWKAVTKKTELASTDLVKAYFAYTIPAGALNETNQIARYRLPANLHLTDDQILAINQMENGIARTYVNPDTGIILPEDTDNYNKYLGAEAIEGTRTPDKQPANETPEYISAVVKAENIYDEEGLYGEKGACIGQDLIFIFTPYTIEKNQNTYDADGTPTTAGQKVTGWFACDLTTDQIDWQTIDQTTETVPAPRETLGEPDNTCPDAAEAEEIAPETEKSSSETENPSSETDTTAPETEKPASQVNNTALEVEETALEAEATAPEAETTTSTLEKTITTIKKEAIVTFAQEDETQNVKEITRTLKLTETSEELTESTQTHKNTEDENGSAGSTEASTAADPADQSGAAATAATENPASASTENAANDATKDPAAADMPAQTFSETILVQTTGAAPHASASGAASPASASGAASPASISDTDASTKAGADHAENDPAETNPDAGTEHTGTNPAEADPDAAAQKDPAAETIDQVLPEQANLTVYAAAEEGTFPAGTTMTVTAIIGDQLDAVSQAIDTAVGGKSHGFQAIDISFHDAEGNEIEPAKPIRVTMTSETIRKASETATVADPLVVHVDNDGKASAIDQIDVTRSDVRAVDADSKDEVLTFESDSFSAYVLVYTVDFHWEIDGQTYEYDLAGGDSISFRKLAEILHVVDNEVLASADAGMNTFMEGIEDIQFSSPELVWVGRLQKDATAGDIAAANGLDIVYSADQTEDQKAYLQAKAYTAGEWVLLGVKPFNTQETLTVTMKTGETFTIVVTDAQIYRRFLSADGTSYDITVMYGEDAQIPDGSDLRVKEITPDAAEYPDYLQKAADQLGEENTRAISCARFFDIEIVDGNGEKVEPSVPVLVNIQYVNGTEIEAAKDVHVVHFADDGTEVLEGIAVNQDGTVMTYLQNGFSVTGTVVTKPAANEQYMVLIEYDLDHDGTKEYYIVNNDGSLTKASDTAGSTVDVDEPMMWTYDGKNIYHHSEQVSFNNQQVAADFYNKYIDPTDSADGISKDQDNPGTTLRNVNEQYFDWSTWSQKTFTYQVIQNRPQKNVTQITFEGDNIKSANSNQYLGVVEDADGTLRLVGGVSKADAATVRLAAANEVLKTMYLNHTVNHIDISIEGEAAVDVPLAYGTYYNAKGEEIKTVSSPETLHLDSGVVGITMEDMKRAIITAYTMDDDGTTHELDNAFTVSGYSANESTAYSTQQVRIEGDFRVANIDPVSKSYYDKNKSKVYQDRLNHKIYYKVTAYKTLTYNLIDPELGQLYDEFGNPMKVSVDVAFSASFNYWDKANECPPLQWDGDWQKGGIPDHNLSGMDFVLGGNSEGDAESRAVEIIKIIEDENGSPIQIKTPLDHSFLLHYYKDDVADKSNPGGTSDNLRNQEQIWNIDSPAYENYDPRTDSAHTFVDAQNVRVRVGTSGMGQSYTYDYNSGMFYITEDTKTVPDEIIGADGDTWYYASTVIETEYVRRYAGYDNVKDENGQEIKDSNGNTVKNTHKSTTYTDKSVNYDSRAEVLGNYKNQASDPSIVPAKDEKPDNEFLEFTVHNVYRKSKAETTDLNVTKNWEGTAPDDVTEVYVKIYRKTQDGQPEDVTDLIRADRDNLSLYVTRPNFDTSNGWIVVKKTNDGWENVKVKSLPVADNEGNNYTYYIEEAGYKQGSEIHKNVDAFTPSYTVRQGNSAPGASGTASAAGTDTDMGDGVVLLDNTADNTDANGIVNQFTVTNAQAKPIETSYTVTKQFKDQTGTNPAYPTDGSVQVVMGLQRGYMRDEKMVWEDAGVTPVTLPNTNPNSDPNTDVTYYGSETAWTHTWDKLPAMKKIGNDEYTLSYRAVELSAPDWFDVDYAEAAKNVEVIGEGTTAYADPLTGTVTNKPNTCDLTVSKQWTKDGKKIETWPENVESVQGEILKYWHVARVDETTDPVTITLSDAFKSEMVEPFTLTKDTGNTSITKNNLTAYEFRSIVAAGNTADDDLIVAARQVGVTLEHGKTYLIVYTYGAKETQVNWTGDKTTAMAQEISGEQNDNSFTATFTNDVTDISVKKEWRHESTTTPDAAWPEGASVNYKIMRVPVYTDSDGKVTEFDSQEYITQDSGKTMAAYQGALESGHSQRDYTNLPTMGAENLTEAKYGLQSGTYPVTYRYYVQEDPTNSVAPTGSVYEYTANEAQIYHGVATLVNEYTDLTVTKKWVRNGETVDFPANYKVNWKVVQKDQDGNVINGNFYVAYESGDGGHDHRLTSGEGNNSYTLAKIPAKGTVNGKEVTYTYDVYEVVENSESPASDYPFQAIKAEEGIGNNAGKYTITNDLTQVTVKKEGEKGTKVEVELYASTEKPSSLETVDVKVAITDWGKDTLEQDRGPLATGKVTGTLIGSDGSERPFSLTPDNWAQTFAGLPKYKSGTEEEIVYSVVNNLTYPVSGTGVENIAIKDSTAKKGNDYTISLSADGQANAVAFKFIKGDNFPDTTPDWRVLITVKDSSGNVAKTISGEDAKTLDLGWMSEKTIGPLKAGEYTITYEFADTVGNSIEAPAGYGIKAPITFTVDANTTGTVEKTVDLTYTPPKVMYEFKKGNGWPSDSGATQVKISIKDQSGQEVMSTTGSTKNLASNEESESSQWLDCGTYTISYSFAYGGTGYTIQEPAPATRVNETGLVTILINLEQSGPQAGEMKNTFSLKGVSPENGFIKIKITGENGVKKYVTLNPGNNWTASVYLPEKNEYNTAYNYKAEVDSFDTSVFGTVTIKNGGNFSTYSWKNPEVNATLVSDIASISSTSFSMMSFSSRFNVLKLTLDALKAVAGHPDQTITAPAEPNPDLTGDRKISVVDKSNLPEGAQSIAKFTLDANNTNAQGQATPWEHTWENLPRIDKDGNTIYYYVVEKEAYTDTPNVTSTTATYDIKQNENGEFVVTITNTTTTEEPKTGTLVVEKEIEGASGGPFKFSLKNAAKNSYLNGSGEWKESESEAWIEISPGQKITFTRLPLGNYILKEEADRTKITAYVLDSSSVTGTAGSGISVIADGTSEFTFKNVYTPAPIRVTKAWKNADGSTAAPTGAKVQFQLYKNGSAEGDPITLDGTPDDKGETAVWVAEWKDMPRQDDRGNSITYTVKEVFDDDGYGWEHYKVTDEGKNGIAYDETDSTKNVITNEEQVTEIAVTKQWKQTNGEDNTDPKKTYITYTLYQMYTDSVGEKHFAVFTQAQFKVKDSAEDPALLTDGKGTADKGSAIEFSSDDHTWNTINISNLPEKVLGEDGNWYDAKYYVVEDGIADVTPIYQLGEGGSDKPEDAAAGSGTITIVNTEDSNSLRVEKTWDDLGPDTPYELTFKVQYKARNAGDDVEWTDVEESAPGAGTYRLVFNGSTYTIAEQKDADGKTYTSNTITNLDGSRRYRVVELSYKVNPGSSYEISKTFSDEDVNKEISAGTSTTPDNGLTWVSGLSNTLEKIKIDGTKTWNDNKGTHADPRLILERTVGDVSSAETTWEKVTATKLDPTRPALAPAGEEVGAEDSEYTFLTPIWSTKGKRTYTYNDLPKYSPEGKEYTYRVTEAPTAGFTPTYRGGTGDTCNIAVVNTDNEGTVNIINNPVGKLQVEKSWFAGADTADLQSIEFVIERNFDKNAAQDWTAVANAPGSLPDGTDCNADENGKVTLNAQTTDGAQITPGASAGGNPTQETSRLWKWNSGKLPRFMEDPDGSGTYKEVYYRVRETRINGTNVTDDTVQTTWQIIESDPARLDAAKTVTLTIKNDKPQISISGTKTWVTDTPDNIPSHEKFKLNLYQYKDGQERSAYTLVNVSDGQPVWTYNDETHVWTYAYTGLDRYYYDDTTGENLPWRYYIEEEITDTAKKDKFIGTVQPGQIMESGDLINYNFTNTDATSIKIIKKWMLNEEEVDGDPFDKDHNVEINLIQKKGAEAVAYGTYEIEKKDDNGTVKWELEIRDLPKLYRDANGDLQKYSYYVIEQNTGIWRAEYSMTPDNPESWTMAANQMDANGTDKAITIRNSTYSYELPSTGGIGTRWIYILGGMLTMAAGLLLLLDRKRNRV